MNFFLPQVCSHSDQGVRAFGADALTSLIRTALEQKYEEVRESELKPCKTAVRLSFPSAVSQDLQPLLLSPLEAMTAVQHTDVRQKQLECVSHVS